MLSNKKLFLLEEKQNIFNDLLRYKKGGVTHTTNTHCSQIQQGLLCHVRFVYLDHPTYDLYLQMELYHLYIYKQL